MSRSFLLFCFMRCTLRPDLGLDSQTPPLVHLLHHLVSSPLPLAFPPSSSCSFIVCCRLRKSVPAKVFRQGLSEQGCIFSTTFKVLFPIPAASVFNAEVFQIRICLQFLLGPESYCSLKHTRRLSSRRLLLPGDPGPGPPRASGQPWTPVSDKSIVREKGNEDPMSI